MATELKVTVPDIGDYQDVPVIEVLVKVGDTVEKDAALVTLESDKATLDVPAPEAGVVKSISIKAGDKVSMGAAVLVLETGGDAAAAPAAEEPKAESKPESAPKAEKPAKAEAPAAEAPAAEKKPAPAKAAKSSGAAVAVTVPDIGDYQDVPIIEVLVKDGDTVEKDQTLMVLESDKATLDVPAPSAGVVGGFKLKVGDKVSKGTTVCTLAAAGDEPAEAEPEAEPEAEAAPVEAKTEKAPAKDDAAPKTKPASSEPAAAVASSSDVIPYASPSIRKFARELGVDLAKVSGSGQKGRITQEDVQSHVKKVLAAPPAAAGAAAGSGIPPIPAVDFSQFGEIETKPLARIRKISAAHLHRSWLNIPHVTQTDEADITELEAFRKEASDESAKGGGPKLTLLPFVMKAVAKAMDAYPEFRASLSPDGESLIHKNYTHIGFAADTPNGLMVPVVREVDKKGLVQLAIETGELAKKARDGKLSGADMKGGVFSISSLGGIGGSHFTPIVNAPEVGILGVSKAVMKPVWDGAAFQPRLMVPLSLSYDHRVIDGAYAARFIVSLVKLLGDMRRLAL
ncbi:dihydrolipoyllysine-residue acetyltransferase [uncultured Nevskia sp.]|uniref:dihydrolipoyllysine-residue acetyltransferase n=1 Tax=uncultured Nevskia sp. TaxID=228950 RepID=UPI0025DE6243|nr:dihydrolipoyllysine-residue acetyltransferase [uncultured Nevskia sp.]